MYAEFEAPVFSSFHPIFSPKLLNSPHLRIEDGVQHYVLSCQKLIAVGLRVAVHSEHCIALSQWSVSPVGGNLFLRRQETGQTMAD